MADEKTRLEALRSVLRAENISYGELAELQSLAEHIEPDDVELLEAAGVPEFPEVPEFDREELRYLQRVIGAIASREDPPAVAEGIRTKLYRALGA